MTTPLDAPPVGGMLTAAEAAEVLGTSPNTLASWRFKGDGPPYYRLGDGDRALVRYRRGELEEWLASHAVRPGQAVAP